MSSKKELWVEYADSETEFPVMWTNWDCGRFYDAEYVKDWVRRCIEDRPSNEQHAGYWERWFTLWFYQFKEK